MVLWRLIWERGVQDELLSFSCTLSFRRNRGKQLPSDSQRDAQRLELWKGRSHPYLCTDSLPLRHSCLELHREAKRQGG